MSFFATVMQSPSAVIALIVATAVCAGRGRSRIRPRGWHGGKNSDMSGQLVIVPFWSVYESPYSVCRIILA